MIRPVTIKGKEAMKMKDSRGITWEGLEGRMGRRNETIVLWY